jgi:hypothetical protein
VSERLTVNAGLRYTLNFPSTEINGQTAVFNLETRQLEYPGREPVRPLKKDNFGPRIGAVYRLTDQTVVSSGYGKVWIEMAGITTPFTTPSFPFLQTVTQRTLDNITPAFVLRNGPTVAPVGATPNAGLGQGVFTVDGNLGSGYAQQWNVSVQRELTANTVVEVSYLGSRITNIGIPDSNINQLTEEQLKLGATLLERVPNPYFGIIPRSSSIGDPMITRAQLMKPYPDYTAVSFYRNNVGTTNYQGRRVQHSSAHVTRPDLLGGLHAFEADRHRLVGVRRVHSDGPADQRRRGRQSQPGAGSRLLDRRHPALFRRLGRVGPPGGPGPRHEPEGRRRRAGERLERRDLHDHAVRGPGCGDAGQLARIRGFTTQRPNLVGDPTLPADERTPARWFNTAAFAAANQFTIGSASRNPVRGPSYHDVDLAVMRRVGMGGERAIELRLEVFNLLNTANFGAPAAQLGPASFGTITTALDPRVVQLAAKFWF